MTPEPDLDDPRVFQAVQEYLADLEAGRKPDRAAASELVAACELAAAPELVFESRRS